MINTILYCGKSWLMSVLIYKDCTHGDVYYQMSQFLFKRKKEALFCFDVADKCSCGLYCTCDFADMKCALERDLGLCCSHGSEGEALRLHSCPLVYNMEKCTPSFSMMEILIISAINKNLLTTIKPNSLS